MKPDTVRGRELELPCRLLGTVFARGLFRAARETII